MRRLMDGYTIIEVMIFLAISGFLLFVTIVTMGNQQAQAEFRSSVNDVNSKIQVWVDQVANGLTGSTSQAVKDPLTNYDCTVDPADDNAYPQLSYSGSGSPRGANPNCIFLGRAMQVNTTSPNNDEITTYIVLGRRVYDPGCAGCVPTTTDSLSAAKPAAAVSPVNLTEHYRVPNGARILKVRNTGPYPDSRLFGFYNSFNKEGSQESIQNGNISVLAVQYPFTSNDSSESGDIQKCIKLQDACGSPPGLNLWPMHEMQICLGSTRNQDTAVLTITSSNGQGASTKVSYDYNPWCTF